MFKNAYFWITLIVMIPFVLIWINGGLGYAIFMLVMFAFLLLFAAGKRNRRRRTYYYDDEEIIDRRSGSSPFDNARNMHIPKISKSGSTFITGDLGKSRRRQQSDMNRIRKNLRGR